MNNEFSWMDGEPRTRVKALVESDPQFAAIVEHTKTLTAMQRNFLVVYASAHYDPQAARKLYETKYGRTLTAHKLNKWLAEDEQFRKAVTLREEMACRVLGISAAHVLARIKSVEQRAAADGKYNAQLNALEMMGKHLRMWGRDEGTTSAEREGPGLVIQINQQISTADTKQEDPRVVVTLAGPSK
jgi:hypothetical protein